MKYFIYCRKSSEAEDRQVMSIESQLSTLQRTFANRPDIIVIDIYQEAFSAKAPGRAIFNEMLVRIERGEAEGIIAWAPDRLARNSIDGGRIIYLLDRGVLHDLKFATYTFENNSQGKFMLQIMFGQSKYYSDALSENVKRGNRTKIEKGWRPNGAPIGYLNDPATKTIVPDPERFPLIRRLLELALTGAYSLRNLREHTIAWGLRTVQRKRIGGKYLTIAGVHRILRNPFYAGLLLWNGKTYQGAHTSALTIDEFRRLQTLLKRPGKPTTQKRSFPFTGLIRCGECGFMVTAEEKINKYGSRYIYYHCSKRRLDYRCRQRSIDAATMNEALETVLRSLVIPDRLHRWVLEEIETAAKTRQAEQALQIRTLERQYDEATRAQTNLVTLRIRDAIDDAEFARQREALQLDQASLHHRLQLAQQGHNWFEPAKAVISFSNRAVSWFAEGDDQRKRQILRAIGSNFLLMDKKLRFEAKKPFLFHSKNVTCSALRAAVEDVRTSYNARDPGLMETLDIIAQLVRSDLALASDPHPSP